MPKKRVTLWKRRRGDTSGSTADKTSGAPRVAREEKGAAGSGLVDLPDVPAFEALKRGRDYPVAEQGAREETRGEVRSVDDETPRLSDSTETTVCTKDTARKEDKPAYEDEELSRGFPDAMSFVPTAESRESEAVALPQTSDYEDDEGPPPVVFGILPTHVSEESIGKDHLQLTQGCFGESEVPSDAGDAVIDEKTVLTPPPDSEVSTFLQESLGSLEDEGLADSSGNDLRVAPVGWRDEPEHWGSQEEEWKEITSEWAREESSEQDSEAMPPDLALDELPDAERDSSVQLSESSKQTDSLEEGGTAPEGPGSEQTLFPEENFLPEEAPLRELNPQTPSPEPRVEDSSSPEVGLEGSSSPEPRVTQFSDAGPSSAEAPLVQSSETESATSQISSGQTSGQASSPETSEDIEIVPDRSGDSTPETTEGKDRVEAFPKSELSGAIRSPDSSEILESGEPVGIGDGRSTRRPPDSSQILESGEPLEVSTASATPSFPESEKDAEGEKSAQVEKKRSLPLAVATGVVFGAISLGLLLAGPTYFAVFAFALVVAAEIEFVNAVRKSGFQPAAILILLGTLLTFVATAKQGLTGAGFGVTIVVLASIAWYMGGVIKISPVANLASTVFGFTYLGLAGALALSVMGFPQPPPNWRVIIAFPLSIAIASDVGGYLGGRRFGKHFVARSVSPRKSLEGYASGLAVALAVAVGFAVAGRIFAGSFSYWTFPKALTACVVVYVASGLGDLIESLLKRSLGLKDMSRVLPGHGGILDRIDSLLAAVPAFAVFLFFAGA